MRETPLILFFLKVIEVIFFYPYFFSVLFTFLLLTPQHDLSAVPGSVFAARKKTRQKQLVHPTCKKADPFLHAVLMVSCAVFAHCRRSLKYATLVICNV